jgi:hypothetical protein
MLGALAGLVSLRQHHYAGQNIAGTRPRHPVAAHAADAWPTRDITFYVPYASGGSTDPIRRRYVELTEKQLKLRVIVENKPGASATPWQEASGRIWPQDIATVKVRPLSPCGRGLG